MYALQNQLMLYGAKMLSPTLFIIITQVQCARHALFLLLNPLIIITILPQTKLLTAAVFAFLLLRRTFSSLMYFSPLKLPLCCCRT